MSESNSSPLQQPSTSRKRRANDEEQETPKRPKAPPTFLKNPSHKAGGLRKNSHGSKFQVQLLMLSALTAASDFSLASETLDAEKFDDMVYTMLGEDPEDEPRYRFYQIKHKIASKKTELKVKGLGKDSGLHLQIYFHSYLLMKDKYKSADYALCTNLYFCDKSKWRNYIYKIRGCDELLKVECERHKFIKDTHKRKELVEEFDLLGQYEIKKSKKKEDRDRKAQVDALLKDPNININDHINSFLDTLVLVTNLPSGDDLKEAIEMKIKEKYKKSETFYDQFYRYMFDWFQYYEPVNKKKEEGGRAYKLTKNDIDKFFGSLDENRSFSNMFGITVLKIYEAEKFKIKFKNNDSTILKIKKFVRRRGEKILILSSNTERLTEIKICQALDWKMKYIDALYSDLSSLRKLQNSYCDPLNAFSSNESRCMIITSGSEPLDDGDVAFLKSLYEEAIKKEDKKIILTAGPEQVEKLQSLFSKNCPMYDKNDKLGDLDEDSRQQILQQTEISLFGKMGKLKDITADARESDLSQKVRGNALETLINLFWNKKIITIGERYKYDPLHVDITRRVEHPYFLEDVFSKSLDDEIFVIYKTHERTLEGAMFFEKFRKLRKQSLGGKNCIISEANDYAGVKEHFKFVCNVFQSKNIHILHWNGDRFIWKRTHGSFSNINKHKKEGSEPGKITDFQDDAIIIGEPGIGKSTLLNSYAIETEVYWPIKIGLKSAEKEMQKATTNFNDLSGIAEFLSTYLRVEKFSHSLVKSLIEYSLNQCKHVVLLLDGYDEVVELTQSKIAELMITLKITNCQVILTSRSYIHKQLERLQDDTAMFSSTLLPYEEEEQIKFFEDFWSKTLKDSDRGEVRKFVHKLRSHLKTAFEIVDLKNLVGIALQARMLAEIFEEDCSKYLLGEIEIPTTKIASGSELYDKFIDLQFERYFKNKRKLMAQEISDGERASLFASYRIAYGNKALELLFHHDKSLVTDQKLTDADLQNMGLLVRKEFNNFCQFIHHTYGEYFIAALLVHALREDRSTVKSFILNHIFKNRYKLIYCFIEQLTKRDEVVKEKWQHIKDCNWLDSTATLEIFDPIYSWESREKINIDDLKDIDVRRLYNSFVSDLDHVNLDIDKSMVADETVMRERVKSILQGFRELSSEFDISASHWYVTFINSYKGAERYLSNAKNENKLESAEENPKFRNARDSIIETHFTEFKDIINNIKNEEVKCICKCIRKETEHDYQNLIDFLIPEEKIIKYGSLVKMDGFCCFLYLFYPSIFSNLLYYIKTHTRSAEKKCEQVIGNFQHMDMEEQRLLYCVRSFQYLQRFYTNVCHDPSANFEIQYFNSLIEGSSDVLERVLISKLLCTITPETAENFIYHLADQESSEYMDYIWEGLIRHILDSSFGVTLGRKECESIQKVNKLSLLKMIIRFCDCYYQREKELIFTRIDLSQSLKLVSALLNEPCDADTLFHTIDYLHFVISKAPYKLFLCEEEILIVDLNSEDNFKCRFSGISKDKMKELLQYRKDNSDSEAFRQRCYY